MNPNWIIAQRCQRFLKQNSIWRDMLHSPIFAMVIDDLEAENVINVSARLYAILRFMVDLW